MMAQLMGHPDITPRDVRDANLVLANKDEYMYLEGIRSIISSSSLSVDLCIFCRLQYNLLHQAHSTFFWDISNAL